MQNNIAYFYRRIEKSYQLTTATLQATPLLPSSVASNTT